jgi:hypothetical protein
VILDMGEKEREDHIAKLRLPQPTLEQAIVHAKKMWEFNRKNFDER